MTDLFCSSETSSSPATTVSVKLPEFYLANLALWFLRAEAQFGIWGMSNDETKFWHIVPALDAEASNHAALIINSAKPRETYATLMTFLLKTFYLSQWECVDGSFLSPSWAIGNCRLLSTLSFLSCVSSAPRCCFNISSCVPYPTTFRMPWLLPLLPTALTWRAMMTGRMK